MFWIASLSQHFLGWVLRLSNYKAPCMHSLSVRWSNKETLRSVSQVFSTRVGCQLTHIGEQKRISSRKERSGETLIQQISLRTWIKVHQTFSDEDKWRGFENGIKIIHPRMTWRTSLFRYRNSPWIEIYTVVSNLCSSLQLMHSVSQTLHIRSSLHQCDTLHVFRYFLASRNQIQWINIIFLLVDIIDWLHAGSCKLKLDRSLIQSFKSALTITLTVIWWTANESTTDVV